MWRRWMKTKYSYKNREPREAKMLFSDLCDDVDEWACINSYAHDFAWTVLDSEERKLAQAKLSAVRMRMFKLDPSLFDPTTPMNTLRKLASERYRRWLEENAEKEEALQSEAEVAQKLKAIFNGPSIVDCGGCVPPCHHCRMDKYAESRLQQLPIVYPPGTWTLVPRPQGLPLLALGESVRDDALPASVPAIWHHLCLRLHVLKAVQRISEAYSEEEKLLYVYCCVSLSREDPWLRAVLRRDAAYRSWSRGIEFYAPTLQWHCPDLANDVHRSMFRGASLGLAIWHHVTSAFK